MYQPVIIIGAARSGTNILRDLISQFPGAGTWPCDEINYIWRYGSRHHPTDELPRSLANSKAKRYIRDEFARLSRKGNLTHVVEKTCANSLRVSFVDRIFPEAKYVQIVRDGRDVVASAMKRWVAPLDIPYVLAKARFIPISHLAFYASRYLSNRLHKIASNNKQLASWGPRFQGMEEMVRSKSLEEVCAVQWARSVQKSGQAFSKMELGRYITIRYEDFVSNAVSEMGKIGRFLGISLKPKAIGNMVCSVSDRSVGRWQRDLDQNAVGRIMPHISPTLKKYGYLQEE
ncbi:MAG: sulfotransferase [Thermodesulfobacteriota bacterium]|nr:sulfotransferase [Thermodesulfobacteriota bacterium]